MIRRILETTVYHPEGEEAPKKRTKETIYGTMNVKRTVSMTTVAGHSLPPQDRGKSDIQIASRRDHGLSSRMRPTKKSEKS
jgi:hypothetical protein